MKPVLAALALTATLAATPALAGGQSDLVKGGGGFAAGIVGPHGTTSGARPGGPVVSPNGGAGGISAGLGKGGAIVSPNGGKGGVSGSLGRK